MLPQSIRVFVVYDEPIIAMTLAKILQQHGYRAAPYVSPLQALTDARVDPPDLFISDILMPEISGLELAETVRAELPECGILLFSGHAHTGDLSCSSGPRVRQFPLIAKPVHPAVLLAELQEVLAAHRRGRFR